MGPQPPEQAPRGPARAHVGHLHRGRVRRHERGHGRPPPDHGPRGLPRDREAVRPQRARERLGRRHRHAQRQARQPAHPAVPGLPQGLLAHARAEVLRRREELLGHGRPGAHLRARRQRRGRAVGSREHRRGGHRHAQRRDLRDVQHAQGLAPALLPHARPEVHGLLRDRGAQPHPGLAQERRVLDEPRGHVHVPGPPRGAPRVRQHGHVLRGHGPREPRQVPRLDLLPVGRGRPRQPRAARQPLRRLDARLVRAGLRDRAADRVPQGRGEHARGQRLGSARPAAAGPALDPARVHREGQR
ncbi:hypothetical protein D3C74_334970 [compost metagenome]